MGICKCFLRSVIISVIAVLLIVLIPNLPPYADITKSFSLPKIRPLDGPLAINEILKDTEIWHKGKLMSPEAFAEYNGELYTTLHGGVIAKLVDNQIIAVGKTGKPCKFFYEEKICGRPLGLRFDENGILYVADPYYGILKFNFKKDQKDVIVSPNEIINGKKPKLFNSLAVARNGDLFWSDSSTQFYLQDLVYDALSDPTGRLVHYDAKTKKNTVLIDNLHFANGVMLSKDEDFVLVVETFYSRIHRYYLKGPKKGTHDIFVDGLPGMPDNLQSDGKDGFLAPLVEAIDEEHPTLIQILFEFPNVRKFLARIMGIGELTIQTAENYYSTEFAKKAIHFIGHYRSVSPLTTHPRQTIVHLSKNGEILESFTTTDKKLRFISDAFIFKDQLYLGSPINDYIGRIPLAKLSWEQPKVKRSAPEPKVEVKQEQPKQTTTPSPKLTTPPPKQQTPPPKATTPPPKQQTPPSPKATTPSPKQQTPPPPTPTTPPPTPTTPPPKQQTPPPKQQTPPPPKHQTPPPPKQQTPPPPKQQTPPPPKQQTPPPLKQQTPPPPKQQTPPPPKQQTPPPPKQQTPPPPKVTTPPPAKQQTQPPSKTTSSPSKEATGGKQKEPRAKNEL